jgi:segregation and condensation protein B
MEITNLIPHIEALIFASDKALTSLEVTDLVNNAFGFMEDKITLDQVETALEGIQEKYNSEFYPFEIRQSGGGWQFLTKKDFHKTIAQLNGDKFLKRLSPASLETLAIIAYKQPVTKGEIEAIRGVSSDYAVQKLLEKELIVISGRNENLPGHPLVYATSKNFMDYFGINTADDLPKIKEVLAEQLVEPTVIKDAIAEDMPAENIDTDLIEDAPDAENIGEAPDEEIAEETTDGEIEETPDAELSDETPEAEINEEAQEEDNADEEGEQPEVEEIEGEDGIIYSVAENGELIAKNDEEEEE